jgi:hypothetical protein
MLTIERTTRAGAHPTQTAYFSNVTSWLSAGRRHSNYNTIFGRSLTGDTAAGSLHVAPSKRCVTCSHKACASSPTNHCGTSRLARVSNWHLKNTAKEKT